MAVNVQIEAKERENNLGILRRFRNRIKTSGVLQKARSLRYHSRSTSEFKKKQARLKTLDKKKEREHLYKLGKISDTKTTRR